MTSEATEVLRRAVERWNAGDLEGYLRLYDPACTLHGVPGDPAGLDAIRASYQAFWAAFPGCQLHLDDVVAEGDKAACRFTLRGTHAGDFQGIAATGREVALAGITLLHFRGERCVERWNQADLLGLLQQLGAIPAPGEAPTPA